MIPFRHSAILLLAAMAACACQTAPKPETPPAVEAAPAAAQEFQPAPCLSPIRLDKGDYPTLFAPESFALWAGAEVASLRRSNAVERGEHVDSTTDAAAARINEDFLIIECHVASRYSDVNIAKDAVSFRDIKAYLIGPEDRKVSPVQTIIGVLANPPGQQEGKEARRTNLLIFWKRDLSTGTPAMPAGAPSARLVLESYSTKFYFEWAAAAGGAKMRPPNAEESVYVRETGYADFFSALTPLLDVPR